MTSFEIARKFLGEKVEIVMDRPLGSKHPKHGFEYEVNYGYIPNTKSSDGEELDGYYLGIDKPLKKAKGVCVAIIHRTTDDDDKLIVVSKDKTDITDEEIEEAVEFQEKWFPHVIVRKDPNHIIKYIPKLPYRKGVIGIIINEGEALVIQNHMYGPNDWRYPGGGVEQGESHDKALLRELLEELGSDQFEILQESKHVNKYDWPEEFIVSDQIKKGRLFRGQEQKQFLVSYNGNRADLKIDPIELRACKWVKVSDLESHFNFNEQWEEAQKVLCEFKLI